MAGLERVLEQIDERRTIALLQELVRIPSVNPPGAEAAVAQRIADRLDQPRLEVQVVDLGEGRANTVARLRGAPAARLAL